MIRRTALLLLILVACGKPPIVDPAEEAYRHAMELFSKASAETHDLTYRDPRFDDVLAALALVPQGDELRGKADALVQRIKLARAEADRADGESNNAISQALAAPEFNPQPRDAPFPVPTKSSVVKSTAVARGPSELDNMGAGMGAGSYPGASPPVQKNSKLPSFYRQAGYLGAGKGSGLGPPALGPPNPQQSAALGPPQPAAQTADTAVAQEPPTQAPDAPPSAPPPGPPPGPPPVFGLPGPAGRAILGGH